MPHYLTTTTCNDRENDRYNIVVHWDHDDPNTIICQLDVQAGPTGGQRDPDRWYITDDQIDQTLQSMGFRIIGKDALDKGQRVVMRDSDLTFYDPMTRQWYRTDPNRND